MGYLVQYYCYFQGYWKYRKINYWDICRFTRDICLFTSRDMGYLVPPYTSLILKFLDVYHANKCWNANYCWHFNIYEHDIFLYSVEVCNKKFDNLLCHQYICGFPGRGLSSRPPDSPWPLPLLKIHTWLSREIQLNPHIHSWSLQLFLHYWPGIISYYCMWRTC